MVSWLNTNVVMVCNGERTIGLIGSVFGGCHLFPRHGFPRSGDRGTLPQESMANN